MNFEQAFTVWRELGADGSGQNISFQALTAIHYVHRLGAYIVFAAVMFLTLRLYRIRDLQVYAAWLAGLMLLQVATGLGNVLLGWPLLAAVMHTGGAAGLVVVMTGIVCATRKALATEGARELGASRVPA